MNTTSTAQYLKSTSSSAYVSEPTSTPQKETTKYSRSSRPQNLMPPRPRKKRQHARKQQRANQQNRDTHGRRMAVQRNAALLRVLHQSVKQVDGDDQQAGDGEGDERAGAEVDARLRVIDFVGGAGFEGVFLWRGVSLLWEGRDGMGR